MAWSACGDYETIQTGEEYTLYRNIFNKKKYDSKAGDAMWGALPAYLNYSYEDKRCNQVYAIWGPKTQGELYHVYLLAIACLIEARLNTKAFVYGDVSRGQCKRAVSLANQYLTEPIDVPARCDMERFYDRVSKMKLSEKEQLDVFVGLYLGTKDDKFGAFVRRKFSEFACEVYWQDRFRHSVVGTIGFDENINEYLLWGFDLRKLCRLVNYEDEKNGPRYESFVRRIMEAKLHIKYKNCTNMLEGARNKKVDRYINIEEIRSILLAELGEKCNVEAIIDAFLEQEKFTNIIDNKEQGLRKRYEDYDIIGYDELLFYKHGLEVYPQLRDVLKEFFLFYDSLTEEDEFKQLLKRPCEDIMKWLVEQNEYFLLRDKDWEKIFTEIQQKENALAKYYPMMRVKITSEHVRQVIIALVVNNEFYEFCDNIRNTFEEHHG